MLKVSHTERNPFRTSKQHSTLFSHKDILRYFLAIMLQTFNFMSTPHPLPISSCFCMRFKFIYGSQATPCVKKKFPIRSAWLPRYQCTWGQGYDIVCYDIFHAEQTRHNAPGAWPLLGIFTICQFPPQCEG